MSSIRAAVWNIGGGGGIGAEQHFGHVLDAIAPGGALHDHDILILTESKLRDFTTLDYLGRCAHLAHAHRIYALEEYNTCPTSSSYMYRPPKRQSDVPRDATSSNVTNPYTAAPARGARQPLAGGAEGDARARGASRAPLRCPYDARTCAQRVSTLALTSANIAHASDDPRTDAASSAALVKAARRAPWAGVLVLVLDPTLSVRYESGSKLGLLCIKVSRRSPTRTAWEAGRTAPTPPQPHADPLAIFALYNPCINSSANETPRGKGAPEQSDLLLAELKMRYAEAFRRYKGRVVIAGDFNMRLSTTPHAPKDGLSDATSAALYPTRSTPDRPSSHAAARSAAFASLCSSLAVTIAHGSFPHQAAAYYTSRPVASAPSVQGTAEVDAILAPWGALRAVGSPPTSPMRVVALPQTMRWPAPHLPTSTSSDDSTPGDSSDDAATVPASLTHIPVSVDIHWCNPSKADQGAPASAAPPAPDHVPPLYLNRCLVPAPYSDRRYYERTLPPLVDAWAARLTAAVAQARALERPAGAPLPSLARDGIYAEAVRSLQAAAIAPSDEGVPDPSQIPPDLLARRLRREAKRGFRQASALFGAIARAGSPTTLGEEWTRQARANIANGHLDGARRAQRDADAISKRSARDAVGRVARRLERERLRNPSKFFKSVEEVAPLLNGGPSVSCTEVEGPSLEATRQYVTGLFTETRPPPAALGGAWDQDTYCGSTAPVDRPTVNNCPTTAGATGRLWILVYLLLYPITRHFAAEYEPHCVPYDACPLCTAFKASIDAFLSKPTSLSNLPPIFPSRLSTAKAAGTDSLRAELLSFTAPPLPPPHLRAHGGHATRRHAHRAGVCRAIAAMMAEWLESERVPTSSDFGLVRLSMIGKPAMDDPTDPAQNRPISVENFLPKLFDAVLNVYIIHHISSRPNALVKSQIGGLPLRNSEMHVLHHNAVLSHIHARGEIAVAIFGDVKGAYPGMDCRLLPYLLARYDFSASFTAVVNSRLASRALAVRSSGRLSAPIHLSKGLQQGQVPAPIFWALYYDPLLRRLERLLPSITFHVGSNTSPAPPEKGFVDDLSIYLAFPADTPHPAVVRGITEALAIIADYEHDFNVMIAAGERKTAIILFRPNPPATPAEANACASPLLPAVPFPAAGSVWTPAGARRDDWVRGASVPDVGSSPLPPPPPGTRLIPFVKTYKYLGEQTSHFFNNEAFVARVVSSANLTLIRVFAFNRVTLSLNVATKMQLFSTLMLGATAYLMTVHRLTEAEAKRVEAPIRRALAAIFGLPRGGAITVLAAMEGPAALPVRVHSLGHRLRMLCTLLLMPDYADNPAASLARLVMGARPAGGGLLIPPSRIAGVSFFSDIYRELSDLAPSAAPRGGAEPRLTWSEPTTPAEVIPRVHTLRITAAREALASAAFPDWRVSRPALLAPATRTARLGAVARSSSASRGPEPRLALTARPPLSQGGHAAWLYHSTSHAPASAAGLLLLATPLSWTGPGGAGRLVAHAAVSTAVAAPVMRARYGATSLEWRPFTRAGDKEPPLNANEIAAVCRVCHLEPPADKLVLCSSFCGQGVHWTRACGGTEPTVPPPTSASKPRGTATPTSGTRGAKRPLLGRWPDPVPAGEWFCSRRCRETYADFHASRRAEAGGRGNACTLCAVQPAPPEDLWHLLFECNHPQVVELQRRLHASAASATRTLLGHLERALRRARSWYPGTDFSPAELAIRGALRALDAAVGGSQDAASEERVLPGEPPSAADPAPRPTIDNYTIYRLILACPFPEDVIPPPPPPADDALIADPFSMARSIGKVFDKVILPTVMLRPAATALVRWASEWINAVATARRRLRAARTRAAVPVAQPSDPPPPGQVAGGSPAGSQPTASDSGTEPASPSTTTLDPGHDPGTAGAGAVALLVAPSPGAAFSYDDDP